ncbi:MAG: dihydrofolate reductase [Nanoarchaeota archaeon]
MAEGNLVLIAAVADNGVIGLNGGMPWKKIREDFRRFRTMTLKHGVVMGRATAESLEALNAFPLDQRLNVVISTTKDYSDVWDNVMSTGSLGFGLEKTMRHNSDRIGYVIGGGQIYAATITLPENSRLEITRVHQNPEGDTWFPVGYQERFKLAKNEEHRDEGYSFETWTRR